MASSRHPILAREGWIDIVVLAAAAILVTWLANLYWAAPIWLLLVFVTQFFRDPARTVPLSATNVICPADGRVVKVDQVRDPWLDRDTLRISIFMNVFNVHSNRSPVSGEVKERWYHRGQFLNAALDKAALENERNALWVKTEQGIDVVVVQVAGLIARRILCYKQKGDTISQGERFGFIRYGSRVDIYLPTSARARVAIGDRVKSGSDVIAELVA
jgi:phosphatidylserine decarboxylase